MFVAKHVDFGQNVKKKSTHKNMFSLADSGGFFLFCLSEVISIYLKRTFESNYDF